MKNFFFLVIFHGFTLPVFASHIVGGEMVNGYPGRDANPGFKQYKISLKLFHE